MNLLQIFSRPPQAIAHQTANEQPSHSRNYRYDTNPSRRVETTRSFGIARRRVVLTVLIMALSMIGFVEPSSVTGQNSSEVRVSNNIDPLGSADTDSLNRLLTQLVLTEIPHQYTDDRKWGMQQQVYAGFKFRRDQGRLETERVWKQVNHGQWQKFTVALRDPQREFAVTIPQVRKSDHGSTLIELEFVTPLTISARLSQWQRGVQLYSFSATGWAQVALRLECDLQLRVSRELTSGEKNPAPLLVLEPKIIKANIDLQEFRLDRVSKVGGEVSQQLGRWVEKELQQKISEKSPELVKRINQQLDRHRDRLVVPIDEILNGEWMQMLTKPLPSDWRSWIPNW